MMIGGAKEIVDRLDPIFKALAPGLGDVPRTPGRDGRDPRAEQGYIHAGPNGAGHFVKMVHNGIEYGLMQAFAEGFDILKNANSDSLPEDTRFDLDLTGYRRSLAPRQRHQLVAARSDGKRAGGRSKTCRLRRRGRGFRRRPLDRAWPRSKKRFRPTCCRPRSTPASARAASTLLRKRFCRRCAKALALTSSRNRGLTDRKAKAS